MKMTPDDVRVLLEQLKGEYLVLSRSYNHIRDMRQAPAFDLNARCFLLAAEQHIDDAIGILNFLSEERSKI